MEIANEVKKIKTKEDLTKFLELVLEDFRTNKDTWENDTLDRFLSALAQFTKDFNGYRLHNPLSSGEEDPSWRTFGEILVAAIYYE